MPRSYCFIDSKGELLTFGVVRKCCDEWEAEEAKKLGETLDEDRTLTMFDILGWVAICGKTIEDTKKMYAVGNEYGDERIVSLLDWLEEKIDIKSFGASWVPRSMCE
jgi:hypothetical protein